MAAFLQHCPYLKTAPKPALRRTGAALLSLADRCPIIARQISVGAADSLDAKIRVSPVGNQRRWLAQSAAQEATVASKSCPFVTSQIGMVQASPEVQEDIKQGSSVKMSRVRWKEEKV